MVPLPPTSRCRAAATAAASVLLPPQCRLCAAATAAGGGAQRIGLDLEAKSCIPRQVGNDEKRLVLVGVQTEATDQVTAMVVARNEQKPERLCVGDDSQHLSDVVQNGLRTFRHHKDMQAKMEYLFVRVSGCPT